jgi:hypothetical protein
MAPVSTSRAALSRAAVASAGDGMQMNGGQNAHHEMAGAAGPDGADETAPPGERARPWWVTMAIEVSHCGSGCTLGDVISEFAIFGLGLAIAGVALGAEYVGDYARLAAASLPGSPCLFRAQAHSSNSVQRCRRHPRPEADRRRGDQALHDVVIGPAGM